MPPDTEFDEELDGVLNGEIPGDEDVAPDPEIEAALAGEDPVIEHARELYKKQPLRGEQQPSVEKPWYENAFRDMNRFGTATGVESAANTLASNTSDELGAGLMSGLGADQRENQGYTGIAPAGAEAEEVPREYAAGSQLADNAQTLEAERRARTEGHPIADFAGNMVGEGIKAAALPASATATALRAGATGLGLTGASYMGGARGGVGKRMIQSAETAKEHPIATSLSALLPAAGVGIARGAGKAANALDESSALNRVSAALGPAERAKYAATKGGREGLIRLGKNIVKEDLHRGPLGVLPASTENMYMNASELAERGGQLAANAEPVLSAANIKVPVKNIYDDLRAGADKVDQIPDPAVAPESRFRRDWADQIEKKTEVPTEGPYDKGVPYPQRTPREGPAEPPTYRAEESPAPIPVSMPGQQPPPIPRNPAYNGLLADPSQAAGALPASAPLYGRNTQVVPPAPGLPGGENPLRALLPGRPQLSPPAGPLATVPKQAPRGPTVGPSGEPLTPPAPARSEFSGELTGKVEETPRFDAEVIPETPGQSVVDVTEVPGRGPGMADPAAADYGRYANAPEQPPAPAATGNMSFDDALAARRYADEQTNHTPSGGIENAGMKDQIRFQVGNQYRKNIGSALDEAAEADPRIAQPVKDWKEGNRQYSLAKTVQNPALVGMQSEYGGTLGLRDMATTSAAKAVGAPAVAAMAAGKFLRGGRGTNALAGIQAGLGRIAKGVENQTPRSSMATGQRQTPDQVEKSVERAKEANPDAPKQDVLGYANEELKKGMQAAQRKGGEWWTWLTNRFD